MSKLLLPLAGIGGVGAAGFGGYVLFKDKGSSIVQTHREETFKGKYLKAILEDGSDLWDAKFENLKGNSEPVHPTLKKAKVEITPNEQNAKALHKRGCQEIYESDLKNSPYFEDFKSYCSKNIKEGMGNAKTWISADKNDSSTWNSKLTSLKTHDKESKQALDSILEALKDTLTEADSSWGDDKREKLKNWCDASQKEIFMGESDYRFVHSGLYCLSN